MLGPTNIDRGLDPSYEYVFNPKTQTFQLARVERMYVTIDLDAAIKNRKVNATVGANAVGMHEQQVATIHV